jgi:hypothetical protein
MTNPLTYQIIDKKKRLMQKMRQNYFKKIRQNMNVRLSNKTYDT